MHTSVPTGAFLSSPSRPAADFSRRSGLTVALTLSVAFRPICRRRRHFAAAPRRLLPRRAFSVPQLRAAVPENRPRPLRSVVFRRFSVQSARAGICRCLGPLRLQRDCSPPPQRLETDAGMPLTPNSCGKTPRAVSICKRGTTYPCSAPPARENNQEGNHRR